MTFWRVTVHIDSSERARYIVEEAERQDATYVDVEEIEEPA